MKQVMKPAASDELTRQWKHQHHQHHHHHAHVCSVLHNMGSQQTHTHTRLTAPCPGLPRWAGTRKVKPIWILLQQETVSGSGISWAICKSAPHSRQKTMPALHHSVFYRPDALPATQPTASNHWRHEHWSTAKYRNNKKLPKNWTISPHTNRHCILTDEQCLNTARHLIIYNYLGKSKSMFTFTVRFLEILYTYITRFCTSP